MSHRRWGWSMAAIMTTGSLVAGCTEAPFGMARLNPVLVKEWERDEQFGPTIHTKSGELIRLAAAAPNLPPADQQRLSAELVAMIREEKNVLLVRQMVRTLAAFPTPESLEGLHLAAEHGDSEVRIAACEAWRRKGGREALDHLAKMVTSDTDVDVRIAATRDLANFRDPITIEALGTALDDTNPALQYRAVQSLRVVTGRDLGDNVAAWRQFVAGGEAKPATKVSWTERMREIR